jgi:ATP-dependent Lon protease
MEREVSKVCRKVVKSLLLKQEKSGKITVSARNLDKFLGVRRYTYGQAEKNNQIGQVTGLAWTEVGGELLRIEATLMPGKGRLTQTGQLGDVMQESVQAAMTVVRSRAANLGIEPDFYQRFDAHVHVPEGATPKDGPSAGIAMCTALVSALSRIPVRADVAMTGEITLRGKVLPIGGLKEKLLAAHRGGIKTVLIPDENEKDLADIPKVILKKLEVRPVSTIDQVLELALTEAPQPLPAAIKSKEEPAGKSDVVTTH